MQNISHIIYIRGTSANNPVLSLTFASLPSAAGRTGAANRTVKNKTGNWNQAQSTSGGYRRHRTALGLTAGGRGEEGEDNICFSVSIPLSFLLFPPVHPKQPLNLLPGVVFLLLLSDSRSHTESELFKPVKFPVWTSEKPKTILFTEQQQWKISITLTWRSCLCLYTNNWDKISSVYIILIIINQPLTFIHSLWCVSNIVGWTLCVFF